MRPGILDTALSAAFLRMIVDKVPIIERRSVLATPLVCAAASRRPRNAARMSDTAIDRANIAEAIDRDAPPRSRGRHQTRAGVSS
jgi:hypothetical protein